MTDEEILKKAIEKAEKNGYKPDGMLGAVLSGELGIGLDPNIYNHLVADRQYLIYIFSHDFAKAFWGDAGYSDDMEDPHDEGLLVWQYHLRQMVLYKNPLRYLELEFMKCVFCNKLIYDNDIHRQCSVID